ncbi:Alpha/Beta hydrolase protein [Phlyctochytrium arcticum]|nr:Alpha/Beta hydrolase protein [Phlyctochytrium arcticum]
MNVIRTADSCFDHLSISYPWDAHYFKIGPMRVHYLDISPDEQEDISEKSKRKTIFLIHGATTWSYLYRNSIQQFLNLGYRVVAIDLPGHGKSDKLSTTQTPLLPLHIAATKHLLNKLLNHNIHPTLVAHGWGALVAARAMQVCGEFRVRGTRLVVVGGYGLLSEIHRPSKEAELHLLAASWYYVTRPWTPLSTVINAGIIIPSGVPLNSNDAMGYDVAYPTSSHGLSPTTLPLLVPLPVPSPIIRPLLALCPPVQRAFSAADLSEDLELAREFFGNAEERGRMYSRTVAGDMRMVPPVRRRYLVICGENDPLWHSTATKLATHAGCRSVFLPHAGHYVPEDQPAELVRIIHAFITEH